MISADDYRFLSDLLRTTSGLSLGAGKEYLLESRLPPVAQQSGHADIAALVRTLRLRRNSALVKSVCDAMTTGETLFFRDQTPFTVFKDTLLPEAAARARLAGRPVRVWSAACSYGQEVYSLAMIVEDQRAALGSTTVEFLATDFNPASVARARQGAFNQLEVQRGLPVQQLVKYFSKIGDQFYVKDSLRARTQFKEHNLLEPATAHGLFDVIFLRNVLIYFDVDTKRDVLERLQRQLVPGGSLVLGGTENTMGVTEKLVRRPGCPAAVYLRHDDPILSTPIAARGAA